MDLPSSLKFKLRVAVIPYTAAQDIKRFLPGGKRDFSTAIASAPQIHRQFLILVPADVRFIDLKPLLKAQYEKLYSQETHFVPLRRVQKIRDEMQCDLDDDFLVAEVCEPGAIVFAVCDLDFNHSKRVKASEKTPVPAFQDSKQNQKLDAKKQKSVEKAPKQKAEEKVEENAIKELKETTGEKASKEPNEALTEPKTEAEVNHQISVEAEVAEKPMVETSTPETILVPEASETTTEEISPVPINLTEEIKNTNEKEKNAIDMEKVAKEIAKNISQDVKKKNEAIQSAVPEKKFDQVQSAQESNIAPEVKPVPVTKPTQSKPIKLQSSEVPVTNTQPSTLESAPTANLQSPITPCPSPSVTFIPRKQSDDSDSSSDDEEVVSEAVNSVFGFELPSLVVTQPKRSEVSILFAADEDSTGESSDDELPKTTSPVPDPASIPSLQEVAESVNRTPTPNQLNQQKQRGRPRKTPVPQQ